MLVEFLAAIVISICLIVFGSVNSYNILVVHKRRGQGKTYAEAEHPSGFVVNMAALGTLIYFLEVFAYLLLVFFGPTSLLRDMPLYFEFSLTPFIQILGLFLTVAGYSLFIWSVIARGQYATSWAMPENQKLVTWGPYKHIRHPSYTGYLLMFFGLFFIWLNLLTLLPLMAIPGYFSVASEEEKLLAHRFGDEYLNYQKRTGRFIPKL